MGVVISPDQIEDAVSMHGKNEEINAEFRCHSREIFALEGNLGNFEGKQWVFFLFLFLSKMFENLFYKITFLKQILTILLRIPFVPVLAVSE